MIKTVLLSGFLGAGKTTVLRRVLPQLAKDGHKLAVLVNDFGKIPVDGALLNGYSVPVREISGGSIFCVCKQAGLIDNLTFIANELKPELLIIEASGLAEPTDVAALFQNTFLRESYARPLTITVADAVNYLKLSSILRVLPMQIKIADTIILSKVDLAGQAIAKTEAELKKLNPAAKILYSDAEKLHGELDLFISNSAIAEDAPLRLCSTATPGFSNCDFKTEQPVNRKAFEKLLLEFKESLLRAKGILDFGIERTFFELVNGEWSFSREIPRDLLNIRGSAVFFALKDNNAERFMSKIQQKIK